MILEDIIIDKDSIAHKDVQSLLQTHLVFAKDNTPENSGHALDLAVFQDTGLILYTARYDKELLGCIALKQIQSTKGEIKSMHVVKKYRKNGIAKLLIRHVLEQSVRLGYSKLVLETGKSEAFAPSRDLYMSFGFTKVDPYGDYIDDPFSYCMEKIL